jgi:hypothetical protein
MRDQSNACIGRHKLNSVHHALLPPALAAAAAGLRACCCRGVCCGQPAPLGGSMGGAAYSEEGREGSFGKASTGSHSALLLMPMLEPVVAVCAGGLF